MHRRVAFRDRQSGGLKAVEYVKLTIGGKCYLIRNDLYIKEKTRMHDIVEGTHEQRLLLVDGYDPATNEYYLERNTRLADHIMDFFATGSLHKPTNICTERFKEELDFWRIGVEYVSSCCSLPYDGSASKSHFHESEFNQDEMIAIFDGATCSSFRMIIWRFIEDPQSSVPAAVFALLSILFVFASVIGLILGSMPEFQEDSTNATAYHYMHARSRPNEATLQITF
ncbi:hypothetical protein WR25_09124 [Diploscapter pachys]|uniref:Potassium channel tetramerisation-type BTB domain-containing protein n=1 Tax=Diploscapter pachys TaxID=2018661 RepID=A0A2A2LI86_9BILA|nr:hypothetical protein WR25_09124 [Diploscapter pachys]